MPEKALAKTLLWSIFSAALGVTAITLPVHIIATSSGKRFFLFNELITAAGSFIIFLSALYLTLYRIYTLLLDLGLEHKERGVRFTCIAVFLTMIAAYFFSLRS